MSHIPVITIMIKNEEENICKTLMPYIKQEMKDFCIYDTGSTDNTVEVVREFLASHNTNFYIVQEPFIDFAQSRNRFIDIINKKFRTKKFFLMIDCEWYMKNVPLFLENMRTLDFPDNRCWGILVKSGQIIFPHTRIFKIGTSVKFKAGVHEYIDCMIGCMSKDVLIIYSPSNGGKQRSRERHERDEQILRDDLARNKDEPRSTFYLAQTLFSLGKLEESLEFYKKRFTFLTGSNEEKFIAGYRAANILKSLDRKQDAIEWYMKCWASRHSRIEPLIELADLYNGEEMYLKYHFAKTACEEKYNPGDTLFVEDGRYDYDRWDRLALGSWYVKDFIRGPAALIKASRVRFGIHHIKMFKAYKAVMDQNLYSRYVNQFNKKVINLVLYSETDQSYIGMKRLMEQYLSRSGIEYYFYTFKEDLETEYEINGNMIYIKGTETYIPGILDKTIKALEIMNSREYDYILRTNISTIVNYEMVKIIAEQEIDYTGAISYSANRMNEGDGQTEEFHAIYGKYGFVSGTCILMSKKCVNYLLENKERLLGYGVVDDLAIGVCINSDITNDLCVKCIDYQKPMMNVTKTHNEGEYFSYRHKTNSREKDVELMENSIAMVESGKFF